MKDCREICNPARWLFALSRSSLVAAGMPKENIHWLGANFSLIAYLPPLVANREAKVVAFVDLDGVWWTP